MTNSTDDLGVIMALLKRFETQRLPRAKRLHERVMQGEKLSEYDLDFLEDVFETAQDVLPIVDKYPKYQKLASQAMSLYKEITEKALENEKQNP